MMQDAMATASTAGPPTLAAAHAQARADARARAQAEALASLLHGSCRLMRLLRPALEAEPGPRHDMVRLLHVPAPGASRRYLGAVLMPSCESIALFLYDDTTVSLAPSTLMLVIDVAARETRATPACPEPLRRFLMHACALLWAALYPDADAPRRLSQP
jgi:hypothetical protein